jgi:hypothetical protein
MTTTPRTTSTASPAGTPQRLIHHLFHAMARNRFLRLSSALLALFFLGAAAHAADANERPLIPLGISDSQTLRVVAFNFTPNRTAKLSVKFLDADGNLLLQIPTVSIAPGKIVTFDYPHPSSGNGDAGRIEIRPVGVLGDRMSMGCLKVTVEIFNDEDGKTTVLWDGPPAL